MEPSIISNHVAGGFEWDKAPTCGCGMLASAIEDHMIFVSDRVLEGHNLCYVYFLATEDDSLREPWRQSFISNCPWCGDTIQVKKKYN